MTKRDAILDYARTNPTASPYQIAGAVGCSPSYVFHLRHQALSEQKRAESREVDLDDLLEAKAFTSRCGGIQEARKVLAVLSKVVAQ